MLTPRQRRAALLELALTTDGPLVRRISGLVLALLPLRLRRPALRLANAWDDAARRWRQAPRVVHAVAVYLVVSSAALLALWIWSRVGLLLCGDPPSPHCTPDLATFRRAVEPAKPGIDRTQY